MIYVGALCGPNFATGFFFNMTCAFPKCFRWKKSCHGFFRGDFHVRVWLNELEDQKRWSRGFLKTNLLHKRSVWDFVQVVPNYLIKPWKIHQLEMYSSLLKMREFDGCGCYHWFYMAEKSTSFSAQSESSLSELPLDDSLVSGRNQRREYHASIRKAHRAVMGGNQININCTLVHKKSAVIENAKLMFYQGEVDFMISC